MKFGKNEATRFYFDDDESQGYIDLRIIDIETLRAIEKKTKKKKVEYKRGQRFEIVEENEELASDMSWDYCIVDWANVQDEDGVILECDKKNKLMLMKQSPVFMSWIGEHLNTLTENMEVLKVEEDENL